MWFWLLASKAEITASPSGPPPTITVRLTRRPLAVHSARIFATPMRLTIMTAPAVNSQMIASSGVNSEKRARYAVPAKHKKPPIKALNWIC